MLQRWKQDGRRLVMNTAYAAVTARIAGPVAGIILVSDSVDNVCLGVDNTLPVSLVMMNHQLEALARTRPRAMLVADMPFALSRWAADVRDGAFPAAQEPYRLPESVGYAIAHWTPSNST
jgi:ketopantoate hydroxymethyltransferase